MKIKTVWLVLGIAILIPIIALIICMDQQETKDRYTETVINLPAGQKLVNASWQRSSLWYLTEPMDSTYVPTTKVFLESSEFGNYQQGSIKFVESK